MLKRFNPYSPETLPVARIEIAQLSVESNNTLDEGQGLEYARKWVRNGDILSKPLHVALGREFMSMSIEEAEELIEGLQSMVAFLKS